MAAAATGVVAAAAEVVVVGEGVAGAVVVGRGAVLAGGAVGPLPPLVIYTES